MRPINSVSTSTSTSPSTGIKLWKSPIPYLFGGLALMMALISVALVILVCSYRKRSSQSSSTEANEDVKQTMSKNIESNSEPELLVIMAGDDKPTYLAKPIITSSSYCTCTCENRESTSSSSTTNEDGLSS
ncbi:PREDICTED: protein GLUTAMINE DUMPER 6-like isoform X2 [Lupinus angustifolius]|uniref:protein GLUTAMINE DUMPER 6-like isoform X2 n=1 Tax=Lupinus angustifolius TaxID=3871 RepID=UPI00092F14F8|nr:PREDICTED: protein GLUTAMINE DUMPER 6-like isoform X2 [Lupinus angustifolius]